MNHFLVTMMHVTMLAMTMLLHLHVLDAHQHVLVDTMDQVSIGHVMVIRGLLDLIFTQDQDICSNSHISTDVDRFKFVVVQEKLLTT